MTDTISALGMISFTEALNTYGEYLYGSKWKEHQCNANVEEKTVDLQKNAKLEKFTKGITAAENLKRKINTHMMKKKVRRNINTLLANGKLTGFLKSAQNDKDFELVPTGFWATDIDDLDAIYNLDTGKISGIGKNSREVYLVKEDFDNLLLIFKPKKKWNKAGAKHKFNYGLIFGIMQSIIENDSPQPNSQSQWLDRISEVLQDVYSTTEQDIPKLSGFKEEVLKEYLQSRKSNNVAEYLEQNPPSYRT